MTWRSRTFRNSTPETIIEIIDLAAKNQPHIVVPQTIWECRGAYEAYKAHCKEIGRHWNLAADPIDQRDFVCTKNDGHEGDCFPGLNVVDGFVLG